MVNNSASTYFSVMQRCSGSYLRHIQQFCFFLSYSTDGVVALFTVACQLLLLMSTAAEEARRRDSTAPCRTQGKSALWQLAVRALSGFPVSDAVIKLVQTHSVFYFMLVFYFYLSPIIIFSF